MNQSTNKNRGSAMVLLLALLLFTACSSKNSTTTISDIQHGIVFHEDGQYGGWPANNGIWNWGDEILVGFVQADHKELDHLHSYDRPTARNKYARSLDGGATWTIEDAYAGGQKANAYDNNLSEEEIVAPTILTSRMPDFTSTEFVMTFQRCSNNIGPTHFYFSANKGKEWQGAYRLTDMETDGIAARTDYIVDGPATISAFITVAKSNKREGRVALIRTHDGGVNWDLISWIGDEPTGFDIMPSSVRLSETKLLTVIRSRTKDGQNYLSSYHSTDNGATWEQLKDPVADNGQGGSPPALLQMKDGTLALAYAYRSNENSRINVRFSADEGQSWSEEMVLRSDDGANRDCGYPRMVQREDGKLVVIYYWNNVNKDEKTYRYIASTTFKVR